MFLTWANHTQKSHTTAEALVLLKKLIVEATPLYMFASVRV